MAGDNLQPEAAIGHAKRLVAEGADFIDVGAESTRPGSSTVPQEEELQRLLPVLKELAGLSVPISADTRKPQVMREAAAAGAAILNDVTALSFTPESLGTAAELKLPAVLMHTQGNPDKMQDNPVYKDVGDRDVRLPGRPHRRGGRGWLATRMHCRRSRHRLWQDA